MGGPYTFNINGYAELLINDKFTLIFAFKDGWKGFLYRCFRPVHRLIQHITLLNG